MYAQIFQGFLDFVDFAAAWFFTKFSSTNIRVSFTYKEKIPDHLVDFCKRLSVNQIVASSRLPRYSHGIFSQLFNYLLSLQAVEPGILQTFSTCAIKHQ